MASLLTASSPQALANFCSILHVRSHAFPCFIFDSLSLSFLKGTFWLLVLYSQKHFSYYSYGGSCICFYSIFINQCLIWFYGVGVNLLDLILKGISKVKEELKTHRPTQYFSLLFAFHSFSYLLIINLCSSLRFCFGLLSNLILYIFFNHKDKSINL